MPKEVKGIIVSRLFVLITVITLPIATFLIYNIVDFNLWYSNDPELTFLIVKVLSPLVFSVSWLFFLVIYANRLSQTLESMDNTVRVVPLRLKFFFGVNALVVLFIFIFPFITPLVSALSFASLAWRLTTFRKQDWDNSEASFGTRFLMITFAILPIFCAVSVLPDYLTLAIFLWEVLWLPLLPWIFVISYCLSTSLAIGSLFILITNSGVTEYEQLFDSPQESDTMLNIRIFEVLFFVCLLILAALKFEVVNLFYNVGFIILLLVYVVNFFSGRMKYKSFKGYLLGYLLAGVFMGSNFIFYIDVKFSQLLQVWSLTISALLFIYVFFFTFIKMEESSF
jgi:hypothetical protein